MPRSGRSTDNLAFFDGEGVDAALYDLLHAPGADRLGDIAYYRRLRDEGRTRILDAACGSARIAAALAGEGGEIDGFDASEALLRQAETKCRALPAGSVRLTRQRLESFAYGSAFDLVILGYYGFSYLLDPASREACLAAIARHLAPGGIAVLHLPAPALLVREVPEMELRSMRRTLEFAGPDGALARVDWRVRATEFDAARRIRSYDIVSTVAAAGRPARTAAARMAYAAIADEEMARLAEGAGLRVAETLTGFDGTTASEAIVVLAPA